MPALSAIDLAMFMLETRERPFNIGPLVLLRPPAGFKGNFADKLHAKLLKRPPGPPFNYRLVLSLTHAPSVEPMADPDIRGHVHRLTLRARVDGAAAREGLRAARGATRPLGAAVAVLRDRRPGRRQRGAVRQGAPRHHRRAHLRQGGDAVDVRGPEGQRGARHVGRRGTLGQGRRPTRRHRAAAGRSRLAGGGPGAFRRRRVRAARRAGAALGRPGQGPAAAFPEGARRLRRQALGPAQLCLLHLAAGRAEGRRQGPWRDRQRHAADRARHGHAALPGQAEEGRQGAAGGRHAGGAGRRREGRQPDRGAAVSARPGRSLGERPPERDPCRDRPPEGRRSASAAATR